MEESTPTEQRETSIQARAKFRFETDFDSSEKVTFIKTHEKIPIINEAIVSQTPKHDQVEEYLLLKFVLLVVLVPSVIFGLWRLNNWLKRKYKIVSSDENSAPEKSTEIDLRDTSNKRHCKSMENKGYDFYSEYDAEIQTKRKANQAKGHRKAFDGGGGEDGFERNHPSHTSQRIKHVTSWIKNESSHPYIHEEVKAEEPFKKRGKFEYESRVENSYNSNMNLKTQNSENSDKRVNIFGQEVEFDEDEV
uniref:Uncharacterized protein n=1 Tax=Euplotes harpa TaxID=151035 RepID=A0A7S3JLC6_9SPIT|mmetsp:Transcript_781/g.733  ORF Transcript_781/g.733 Transcript_781/m.733 type:complete len:249 (+) Transcript_781:27-773(+)